MTVKIDGTEPNVFPAVEGVDVRDAGRNAEVILGTKIAGELIPVTIKLSYGQAETLADLLNPSERVRSWLNFWLLAYESQRQSATSG
jgi:hypothetical protein